MSYFDSEHAFDCPGGQACMCGYYDGYQGDLDLDNT